MHLHMLHTHTYSLIKTLLNVYINIYFIYLDISYVIFILAIKKSLLANLENPKALMFLNKGTFFLSFFTDFDDPDSKEVNDIIN